MMNNNQLNQFQIFDDLNDDQINQFHSALKEVTIDKGEQFIKEGEQELVARFSKEEEKKVEKLSLPRFC